MIKYSEYLGNKRSEYMRLLLIGDGDESKVYKYINQGQLFLAEQDNVTLAVAMIVPTSNSNIGELKNIAVDFNNQGQGIGSQMIAYILEQVRAQYSVVLVGTGDADVQNILFYLKNGFRFWGVRKNFFDSYNKKNFSNGVELQDMVLLTKNITSN